MPSSSNPGATTAAGSLLGKRIQELIESRGMPRTKLAQVTGIPVTTLKRLVTEEAPNPRLQTLSALSSALGVSIPELFGEGASASSNDPAEEAGAQHDQEQLMDEVNGLSEDLKVAMAGGRLCPADVELLRATLKHCVAKNVHA